MRNSRVTHTYPPLARSRFSKLLAAVLYFLISSAALSVAHGQEPTAEPVVWANRAKVSASGGSLAKEGQGAEEWDAGASSAQTIEAGDGYVEFTPGGQVGTWRMCGLSRADADPGYQSIDYAIYTRGDGALHIFEKGVRKKILEVPYGAAETLRVSVEGGKVKYYRAGRLVYTSRVAPVFPLVANSAFFSNGARIGNAVISRQVDSSGPVGRWYMAAGWGNVRANPATRLTVDISETKHGEYTGTLSAEGAEQQQIDSISWEPSTRLLQFRRVGVKWWQWFRGTVVEGVLAGRYTDSGASPARPPLSAFTGHVTGWNSTYVDSNLTTRVYELLIKNNHRARLRLDASPTALSGYAGRLKIYSQVSPNLGGEQPEDDIEVTRWDGETLEFVRQTAEGPQSYVGKAAGRAISGTFRQANDETVYDWSGTRAEVLTYGLTPKTSSERLAWQTRTRRRLLQLMMGGNPAPVSAAVPTRVKAAVIPLTSPPPPSRDDNAGAHPQKYTLEKLSFSYTLQDPYRGADIKRTFGGYLAIPTTPPPPGGWPAAVVVNGHDGSAHQTMNPNNDFFWYGDAIARRGYVVLAVDISHRPLSHRRGLYTDIPGGDRPTDGNGTRPAVVSSVFAGSGFTDSDWEEDGERAWDTMRAIDYLLSLTRAEGQNEAPLVDDSRVLMTGLSMGGEVTAIVSALDQRVSVSVPAGYSPDMGVMSYPHYTPYGFDMNHPCWRWLNADIREYVDVSDYFALVAPRPLVIETGKYDYTYSMWGHAPDKQVARRVRVAYSNAPSNFLHYLHHDQHRYKVGDVNSAEQYVRVPSEVAPPALDSVKWQWDINTRPAAPSKTLFDYIQCFFDGTCGH